MSDFHPSNPAWEHVDDGESIKAKLQPDTWRAEHDTDVTLRSLNLPFYPGRRLIMATCPLWPASTALYWLFGFDSILRLNGVSPPIHEANAKASQRITANNALAYLCFFNFFVRGEEGPFALIASLDDPYLPAGLSQLRSPDEEQSRERRLFALRHQSPRYFGVDPDGKHRYSASLYYSNALFVADLLIDSGGMVEMQSDTPVLADLPFKVHAPLTLPKEFQP